MGSGEAQGFTLWVSARDGVGTGLVLHLLCLSADVGVDPLQGQDWLAGSPFPSLHPHQSPQDTVLLGWPSPSLDPFPPTLLSSAFLYSANIY